MTRARQRIERTVTIAAPPERVFAALTDPAEIPRHFPFRRVRSDGVAGGAIVLEGEAGAIRFTDFGLIEVFAPPSLFRYAYWSPHHGTPRTAENHRAITYRITPVGDASRLEVTHENLPGSGAAAVSRAWGVLLGGLCAGLEARP